jgi:hypothetical protein
MAKLQSPYIWQYVLRALQPAKIFCSAYLSKSIKCVGACSYRVPELLFPAWGWFVTGDDDGRVKTGDTESAKPATREGDLLEMAWSEVSRVEDEKPYIDWDLGEDWIGRRLEELERCEADAVWNHSCF